MCKPLPQTRSFTQNVDILGHELSIQQTCPVWGVVFTGMSFDLSGAGQPTTLIHVYRRGTWRREKKEKRGGVVERAKFPPLSFLLPFCVSLSLSVIWFLLICFVLRGEQRRETRSKVCRTGTRTLTIDASAVFVPSAFQSCMHGQVTQVFSVPNFIRTSSRSLCCFCRNSSSLHIPENFCLFLVLTYVCECIYLCPSFLSAKAVSGLHVVLIFESRPRLCSVIGTWWVWVCASFSVCSVGKKAKETTHKTKMYVFLLSHSCRLLTHAKQWWLNDESH